MTPNEKLAHALKMKFGLAPSEPSTAQLEQIKAAIKLIVQSGSEPSESDWRAAVKKYCPGMASHRYAGIDNTDLNALLLLAIQSLKG